MGTAFTDHRVARLANLDAAILGLRRAKAQLKQASARSLSEDVAVALQKAQIERRRVRERIEAEAWRGDCSGGGSSCGCWRVVVHLRGRPKVRAVAHVTGVANAREARGVVNGWGVNDWDPEAFAWEGRRGGWRYYRLRVNDRLVVDAVEATDC